MHNKDSKKTTKNYSKKKFELQIFSNLSASLQGLIEILGEKKFEARIRKAAKLLSKGIKENVAKKTKPRRKKVYKRKWETSDSAALN